MKICHAILYMATVALSVVPAAVCAQNDGELAARAAARRALEMAKIELRLYLQVEYPRELRRLDSQIKLAAAELAAYEERQREYRTFDRFSTGRPFLVTGQDLRLCLLNAQLRLDDLRAERTALVRFHSDEWRLLELRVHDARSRVAELEGGDLVMLPGEELPAGR
jgi:hypothetical protein